MEKWEKKMEKEKLKFGKKRKKEEKIQIQMKNGGERDSKKKKIWNENLKMNSTK